MKFLGFSAVMIVIIPSLFIIAVVESYLVFFVCGMTWSLGAAVTKPFLGFTLRFFLYSYSMWIQLTSIALEVLVGTRVSVSYVNHRGSGKNKTRDGTRKNEGVNLDLRQLIQPPSKGKIKLMIMNHHSRVDWIYLQLLISRTNFANQFRVVLKEDLKRIPFFGLCIQMQASMLLSRSWAVDKPYLTRLVESIKNLEDSCVLQIYPEGTDLSESNVIKSQEFAKKNDLPQFLHVLNPRTVGVVALKEMFGEDRIESIIDATVGYTYGASGERPSEANLVNENHAIKIHYLVQEYPMESETDMKEKSGVKRGESFTVPRNSEAFAKWIQHQFELKEQLLSRFYHTSPVGFDEPDVKAVLGESIDYLSNDTHGETANEKTPWGAYLGDFGWMRGIVHPILFFGLVPWIVFLLQCYVTGLPRVLIIVLNGISLAGLELLSRTIDLQRFLFLASDVKNGRNTESDSLAPSVLPKKKIE